MGDVESEGVGVRADPAAFDFDPDPGPNHKHIYGQQDDNDGFEEVSVDRVDLVVVGEGDDHNNKHVLDKQDRDHNKDEQIPEQQRYGLQFDSAESAVEEGADRIDGVIIAREADDLVHIVGAIVHLVVESLILGLMVVVIMDIHRQF